MSYPGSEGARIPLTPGEYTRQTKADPLGRGRMVSTNVNDMTGLEDQFLMYCPGLAHLSVDTSQGSPDRKRVLDLIRSVPNGRNIRRIDKTSKGLLFMVTERVPPFDLFAWSIDLRKEEKQKIMQRCVEDPEYFFKEVLKAPPGSYDRVKQTMEVASAQHHLGMSGRSWPRLMDVYGGDDEDLLVPISEVTRNRLIAQAGLTKEELEGAGDEYGIRRLILQRIRGTGPQTATPGIQNPDGTYTVTFDYDLNKE